MSGSGIREGSGFPLRYRTHFYLDCTAEFVRTLYFLVTAFAVFTCLYKQTGTDECFTLGFIQGSSQFSYFTMSDSLSRLCTISRKGNRENVPYVCHAIVLLVWLGADHLTFGRVGG